jgi:DnaJ-class molecular chaperone
MSTDEKTGIFTAEQLGRVPCPDCRGTGQIHFESENINENFETEKQTVVVECPRCGGTGYTPQFESTQASQAGF